MAADVRAKMIRGAAQALSERGLDGTSFSEVLERTGAPRGSVYHHFPGGKDELVTEAVRYVGALVVTALDAHPDADPVAVTQAFTGLWRQVLVRSDLHAGCAVAAVTVAAGGDQQALLEVTAAVFREWQDGLTASYGRAGLDDARAAALAVTVLAAMEGALVLSRATRDLAAFDAVADQLADLAAR